MIPNERKLSINKLLEEIENEEACFKISDLEINRRGKSYTVDTVTELKNLYSGDELFLIIGADMLMCFDKWYRYK